MASGPSEAPRLVIQLVSELPGYLKLACTCVSFMIVTVQLGVAPEQAPPQLMNLALPEGVAVNVTAVP